MTAIPPITRWRRPDRSSRQRRAVAALDDRLARLETERQTIVADQERLRENLKTLGRSPEERRLVQRYTGQLDQQEDRIEAVARDLARVTDERDRAQQELTRLIGGVAFDVATAKGGPVALSLAPGNETPSGSPPLG